MTTVIHEGTKRRQPLINQPGVIAVVSGDRTTYPQFAAHVAMLQTPPGTYIHWELSGGGGVAMARNNAVRVALDRGAPWLWFIDDDHGFRIDTLARLLRHNVDICVPVVCMRKKPHTWVASEHFPVHADMTDAELCDLWVEHSHRPRLREGQSGLIELGECGAAGMLIATEVLGAMDPPWFEFGKLRGDASGEDGWFCLKARRLGFRVWCDLDTPMSHLFTAAVWPKRDKDQMSYVIETDASLRAARMGTAIDDTRCGACGTDLSDDY